MFDEDGFVIATPGRMPDNAADWIPAAELARQLEGTKTLHAINRAARLDQVRAIKDTTGGAGPSRWLIDPTDPKVGEWRAKAAAKRSEDDELMRRAMLRAKADERDEIQAERARLEEENQRLAGRVDALEERLRDEQAKAQALRAKVDAWREVALAINPTDARKAEPVMDKTRRMRGHRIEQ